MPSASDYKGCSFSKVEDLPGAKLGEHLHHIFSGIKSHTATPSTSRNTSVAPSRAHSPSRETMAKHKSTTETTTTTTTTTYEPQEAKQTKMKSFQKGGYYVF
ncbi:hypothetical protein CERZMDRAFT_88782 [Cercospora zeae-maydis SCOH1-5]|uniref:Uncharacterized protein n=1 Tax=Cercospora zeae-maydis SCOH1-5 TaxID=717836 RepID=A0A6A6EZT9_9PEZI|nr:hypothetical protein CERZMDRAFT_88782 [Cercospora zeae-maydis SCOH1-5]